MTVKEDEPADVVVMKLVHPIYPLCAVVCCAIYWRKCEQLQISIKLHELAYFYRYT